MAPLKVAEFFQFIGGGVEYPWLKGHGSIEGLSACQSGLPQEAYPWLKGHGSIEGRR